jgi:mitochondrial fission protein ELM1
MLHGPIGLEPIPPNETPDLILASGGKSVFAARGLAVRYRVPFVFVGERKPYPPGWFHTVFTPSILETAACDVRMDVIPTKITPESVAQAAAAWTAKPPGRLWAMLIGGASRSHHYSADDWHQLAAGMTSVARREGIRWLLTTSRRTGRETEELLRKVLPDDIVADAVWWCHAPEKKLAAYLGAAETIWVTQDSVSMITEAIAAARPVVVVRPRLTPFPKTSFMPGYLENLEQHQWIHRLQIDAMDKLPNLLPRAPQNPTADLAAALLRRLGWPQHQGLRIDERQDAQY